MKTLTVVLLCLVVFAGYTDTLEGSIAFVSDRDGDYDLFIMDADGSNQTQLTNNSSDDWSPAWSPDGRRIAFYWFRDVDAEIFVMDADGSNQTQLTIEGASHPDWCPVEPSAVEGDELTHSD